MEPLIIMQNSSQYYLDIKKKKKKTFISLSGAKHTKKLRLFHLPCMRGLVDLERFTMCSLALTL